MQLEKLRLRRASYIATLRRSRGTKYDLFEGHHGDTRRETQGLSFKPTIGFLHYLFHSEVLDLEQRW